MNGVSSPATGPDRMGRALRCAGLWVAVLLALAAFGCRKNPVTIRSERFFVQWLRDHGESNVVADANGVGVQGNPTRLKAALFGSNQHADGQHVVELDFRIRVAPDREIVEFIAGSGASYDNAVDDALFNFALTTFHVVYKAFVNPADPHQTVKDLVAGGPRKLFIGDLFTRSDSTNSPNLASMRPRLEEVIRSVSLGDGPHWMKIVYGHHLGKPTTVEVTLDNRTHVALTATVTDLNWPTYNGFYMAKEFMVIK